MALMKDYVSAESVKQLAERLKEVYPSFPVDKFIDTILYRLNDLELTERLNLITEALFYSLPGDFQEAVPLLIASLGPEITEKDVSGTDLGSSRGFIVSALCNYIAWYGQDHFELSTQALYEMTKRFSAEGAVRYFIIKHEERMLEVFHRWADDENVHVRRLVSEGLRPRLPWALRLKKYVKDPRPVLIFLEKLKDDQELYVRRSVANNLNDISKDHPALVTEILGKWRENCTKEGLWVIKHALRTLIKQGDSEALKILGYNPEAEVLTENFIIEKDIVKMGEGLLFSFDLLSFSPKAEPLIIDYIIYHKKADGSRKPKVFKLKNMTLQPGARVRIQKQHPFKKITTRRYYKGEQSIALQINGKETGEQVFILDL